MRSLGLKCDTARGDVLQRQSGPNTNLKLKRLKPQNPVSVSQGMLMTYKNKFSQPPERSRSTANCQHHIS